MPVRYNSIEDLTYALLNEIGLSLTPDGFIFDQDTKAPLACGGKRIKASINSMQPVFPSEFTVIFDPFNFKIMNYFLSYYIEKESQAGNIRVNAFSYQDNGLRGPQNKSNIRIKFAGGSSMESAYYSSRSLKLCDIILRLGGMNPDLSNFDKVIENAI